MLANNAGKNLFPRGICTIDLEILSLNSKQIIQLQRVLSAKNKMKSGKRGFELQLSGKVSLRRK